VGMGAMLAATTHSALLAMIMLFELSLNYSLMPPLMLACAVSTLVSTYFHKESVYTEPLRRKGLDPNRESAHLGAATEKTVGDLMKPPVAPLKINSTLKEISERFLVATNNFLPVVDANQKLVGVIALHDLKEFLTTGHEILGVIAYDVMRPLPQCVTPQQKLTGITSVLLTSELRNIPVVNNFHEYKLVGSIGRAEGLSILSEAITARTTSMS
jgi:chloride channel protein, CIC family